jgi:hypothetical protein
LRRIAVARVEEREREREREITTRNIRIKGKETEKSYV